MASYEDLIRQRLGQPIQDAATGLAQSADNQIAQMRQHALAQKAASLNVNSPNINSAYANLANPSANGGPAVLPNDPSMSAADVQSRTNAMINAPQQLQDADIRLQQEAATRQAEQNHMNQVQDQDMSGYTDVPKPQARAFNKIQSSIVTQKPITQTDIRSLTSPGQALSPDQEAAINKQLNPDEDEDGK